MSSNTDFAGPRSTLTIWSLQQLPRDAAPKRIFATGDIGRAHVIAHRFSDEQRFDLGRAWLGNWLSGRVGSGSEWIHLQFHMALFELASQDWSAAYHRFLTEILPSAAATNSAQTDAPALAWRLQLQANGEAELHWKVLRQTAIDCMPETANDFVMLHHLLALAGAKDVQTIDQWIAMQATHGFGHRGLVVQMAKALRASATGHYRNAHDKLERIEPRLRRLGGSSAQNSLFRQFLEAWQRDAERTGFEDCYLSAA